MPLAIRFREIFHNADIGIRIFDTKSGIEYFPYAYEKGQRISIEPQVLAEKGISAHIRRTRETVVINENMLQAIESFDSYIIPGTEPEKSAVYVPLIGGDEIRGLITLMSLEHEHAFSEPDVRLLQTLAGSMSVALENARLFDETQRLVKAEQERVAELAIINEVQQGLAAELDFQAIIDLVGDKLREVFNVSTLGIGWHNHEANLVHYLYVYEHGQRLSVEPQPPGTLAKLILKTRQPVVWNTPGEARQLSLSNLPGTDTQVSKSGANIPIISSDRVIGGIQIENFEREQAFGESELRLLTTIAASLGTALENARLFDETQRLFKAEQERAAELAIINEIQQGLASELDFQAIVDLVGNKLSDVLQTGDLGIRWYDEKTNLVYYLYEFEHGLRLEVPPNEPKPGGLWERMSKTRQPVIANTTEELLQISTVIPGTDASKSSISVPIISGDRMLGSIQLENYEREYAFGETEVRLLTTIAASLGTALENARLFKAEQERVAELAIINEVQQGLASELDFQAIVDLVGEKLREVLDTPDLAINWYDDKSNLIHYMYIFEHAKRLDVPPRPPSPGGIWDRIIRSRQPILWNTAQEGDAISPNVPGTDESKSGAAIPVISGDRVLGVIQVENYEREHAYGESELRLLTTIAASLGTALENARLFKAEQERVAELAIINSVQQGLAAELDFQAIVDLVGDKLRDVLATGDLAIRWYDEKTGLIHYLYEYEHGNRLSVPPMPPVKGGIYEQMEKNRQPVISNLISETAKDPLVPGTDQAKSAASFPIIRSDRVIGLIHLENHERENAFGESEIRLLTTIAASLGTALVNARLFKAEQERVGELQIINSIQQGLAAELDFQAIVNLVGDKLREVLQTPDLMIVWHDEKTGLMHYLYAYEHGKALSVEPMPPQPGGIFERQTKTRQPVVWNNQAEMNSISTIIEGTDTSKSGAAVPIISGDRVLGGIQVENYQHENAFGESELRLLTTIAASLGTALENARLFTETQRLLDETEQRAAELAIINSVGDAIARQMDVDAIIRIVGDQVREVFHTDVSNIYLYDPANNQVHVPYSYDREYVITPPFLIGDGVTSQVIRTRQPVLLNTTAEIDQHNAIYLTELSSYADKVEIVPGRADRRWRQGHWCDRRAELYPKCLH